MLQLKTFMEDKKLEEDYVSGSIQCAIFVKDEPKSITL